MPIEHYTFITDSFSYNEVGMKADKNHYVTGYISTGEVDSHNEVVSDNAMNEMMSQLKSGNIKLDVDHDTFGQKGNIPIGRIIDAKRDEKGIWVKAILNSAHQNFNSVWKSIKEGFLDAFSIAYNIKDIANEVINGASRTILKSIELLNVAITGNPVCKGATMTESFVKSVSAYNKKSEEIKMVDDVKVETPVVEEVATPVVEEPKVNPLDEIKSLREEHAKMKAELNAEIKSLKEKLDKPQLKSLAPVEVKAEVPIMTSPMQAIM